MGVSTGIPITFPSNGLSLEGIVHLPETHPAPAVVICHPHPQYGGDMYNSVVDALVQAALASGLLALRFNFRGTRGSAGAYDNGAGEQVDATAALGYVRSLPEADPTRVFLAGYSFGAAVALAAADQRDDLAGLICVSAPTTGGFLSAPDLRCHALFVSGDRDQYSDTQDLATLTETLGDRAELVVMRGVDHFWAGSTDRLIEAVSTFLVSDKQPATRNK